MASERQQRRNEIAQRLGFRNDYDRRTWTAPTGRYFEQRARGYADKHNTNEITELLDKNSGFWQGWRKAEREGVHVSVAGYDRDGNYHESGEWAEPLHYRYDSAYADWLIEADYMDEDDRDSFGETDAAANQ